MRILLGIGAVVVGVGFLIPICMLLARAFFGPVDIDRHDDDGGSR